MGIFFFILSIILTAGVFTACCLYCLKTIKLQIKLHNSIQLVVLKTFKLHFLIMSIVSFVLFVTAVVFATNPSHDFFAFMHTTYNLPNAIISMIITCAAIMQFSVFAVSLTLFFSRAAVVDRGIHIPGKMIDWHRLYYYHVDDDRHNFVLSINKKGPYTLIGVFGPYKFDRIDSEKIKFILNKNKNKFLTHYDIR